MNHDTDRLRTLMATAPLRPPRLDLDQVVRDGHRIRRRSRYTITTVAAVAVALVLGGGYLGVDRLRAAAPQASNPVATASPTGPPATSAPATSTPSGAILHCTIAPLSVPHGVLIGELFVDPTGRYIVNSQPVVLWTDGRPHTLATGNDVVANAVNAHGVVVGATNNAAWVFRNGHGTTLPKLPGYANGISTATAINARGDIVGYAYHNTGPWAAVIWPAAQPGTVHKLAAPPDPDGAEAYGIGDDGTVVGSVGDGNVAYVWGPDGQGHPLADPPHTNGGIATAISGDWATGWVAPVPDPKSEVMAARWNLRTGEKTVFLDQTMTAFGVTATGDILVPIPRIHSTGDPSILIHDTTPHAIPSTTNDGPTPHATSISRDGSQIVGTLNGTNNSTQAVTWQHCHP